MSLNQSFSSACHKIIISGTLGLRGGDPSSRDAAFDDIAGFCTQYSFDYHGGDIWMEARTEDGASYDLFIIGTLGDTEFLVGSGLNKATAEAYMDTLETFASRFDNFPAGYDGTAPRSKAPANKL